MLMRWIMVALTVCLLSACGSHSKDLPTVNPGDPTWEFVPDHLELGELPR